MRKGESREREGAGVQGHALSQIINFSPLGDSKRIYASRQDEPMVLVEIHRTDAH